MRCDIETVVELSLDANWQEIFAPVNQQGSCYADPSWTLRHRKAGRLGKIGLTDVAEILGLVNGEKDERDWIGVFRIRRPHHFVLYLAVRAGCDYTGWDCQAGGGSDVSKNLEDLIRYGLTEEERKALGVCAHDYGPDILLSDPPQKRCLKCQQLTVWPPP